jgi:MFS-type transporter involved in bile tolerance (Atg22 family)
MSRTYVPAAIQSVAVAVGHDSHGGPCLPRGNDCFVKFGTGWVHSTSYVLYLKAIYTALEGVLALLLMGIADFSNYKKIILIGSIMAYGCFALPFSGLTSKTYATLRGLSALYGLLQVTSALYQILEASYIPKFMRAEVPHGEVADDVRKKMVLAKGSKVSVLGIVMGNLGGICALLIGIIISYTRGGPEVDGYHNFLLAITIAGCVTVVSGIFASYFIPSTKGKTKPKGEYLIFLTFKRMWFLLKQIGKYPNAFLFCVAWVIWNVTYTNFLSVFILLFRSTLGLGSSDAEYTVYIWLSYAISSVGSLTWMFLYPRTSIKIKHWSYVFLGVSLFSNFWGCLGISATTNVGFKHRWEFWLFDVFYSGTSSALRSLNRVVYSTLLPEGEEAQYFGLEVMLGVSVGWIGDLVNATIQDKTGNDRMPFLPNVILVFISLVLVIVCDTEKGMQDVRKVTESSDPESTA